ncbi:MAG: hypothetical protein IT376_17370 [Polyangiaceae bacterium]|nr:hypothetical protein [Polyangiaceae bacterium]
MKTRYRLALGVAASLALGAGCAEEREPISQVQPNALDKSFFVGADLADPADDHEFYTAATVIDVPYGEDNAGLFPGGTGGLRRVKFEILEDVINVRMTYEEIEGVDGHGNATTNNGRVIASYPITSHFDIKRAYNSSTGEEINVITENSSDRPWYQRRFMRVDWSTNLVTSSMHWDPIAQESAFGSSLDVEPLAYNISDPNHADAPLFDLETHYFDVTNRLYVKPRQVSLFGQTVNACLYRGGFVLGGTAPWGNCENSEITVRYSYKRIARPGEASHTDYEPKEWDGTRQNAFGVFTADRLGWDDRYGVVDSKWHRLAQRYNVWQRSHTEQRCSADVDADTNGTSDQCETSGAGSQCDTLSGLCTLPYALREVRPVAWHYSVGPAGDAVIRRWTRKATEEWDVVLRTAVQAARLVECKRTQGRSLEGSPWRNFYDPASGANCAGAFPIQQSEGVDLAQARELLECQYRAGYGAKECEDLKAARYDVVPPVAVANLRSMVVFCESPVPVGADPACGKPGTVARPGDIRFHHLAVWPTRHTSSPWGYGPTGADPLTGEVIAAWINVYDAVTESAGQGFVDQLRWVNGEIATSDITSGEYSRGWVSADDAPEERSAKLSAAQRQVAGGFLLTPEEVQKRTSAVLGADVKPPSPFLPQLGDPAKLVRDLRRDLDHRRVPPELAVNNRAIFDRRIELAKASGVEAELIGPMWLQAAGLSPDEPITEEALERASPLRGLNHQVLRRAEQKLHRTFAERGQCLVAAPEPTGLPALAKVMARKFPAAPDEAPDQTRARVDRMYDYLRGRMHYSVILHEMGHTVGFRHNFVSSYDKFNFRTQYWQLRTNNGQVTQPCTGPSDGESCVGPRYYDPLTQDEMDQSIWTWQHSTVMDYPGELTQDMLGLSVYDYAAARAFYADVVDVIDDVDANGERIIATTDLNGNGQVDGEDATGSFAGDSIAENLVDNMGGLIGQQLWSGGNDAIHYSEWNNVFGFLRNCRPHTPTPPLDWDPEVDGEFDPVFDGQVVLGTVCDRMHVDYMRYDDLIPDQVSFDYSVDPRANTSRRARDLTGRPRVPYGFESDEYADSWYPSTYRHDNGADLYEELVFHSNLYENRHVFDNYRNGRSTFTIAGAYNRAMSRYHQKIADLTQGVAYLFGYYFGEYARTAGVERSYFLNVLAGVGSPQSGFRDMLVGAGLGFDHFMRVLTRPHPGRHRREDRNGDFVADSLLPEADEIGGGAGLSVSSTLLTMPNGPSFNESGELIYGAKPVNNNFEGGHGYFGVDYLNQAGSYYEKALAFDLLLQAGYNVLTFSRNDGVDARFHHNNFVDMWPDSMRRLVGAMLTGDTDLFAPRVTTVGPGAPEVTPMEEGSTSCTSNSCFPKRPLGWVSYVPASGPEVCWPRDGVIVCNDGVGNPIGNENLASLPVDPQLGFEVQKFIAFWSYVYMPEAWELDWVDMMRIYVVGPDQSPDYLPGQFVEWRDPESGLRYLARRFGDETLLGKTYDKGIAAKMIQWANTLTAAAYQVESVDPVTGRVTPRVDAAGKPLLQGSMPTCNESKQCASVRAYRGLLDYMRDTAARLGFPEPALQIYGWGE